MSFARCLVLFLCLLSAVVSCRGAAGNASDLFPESDFNGWEFISPGHNPLATVCDRARNGIIAVKGKPSGYLQTAGSFTNYRLHAEWRWTDQPGNGGLLVHIASGAVDRNLWPRCFQIQLKHSSAGDLLPMAGASFTEPLSPTKPGAAVQLTHRGPSSEKPVGEWNSCEVVCRSGTIELSINGVVQNRVTGCRSASGRIGFQLEGVPFELRNVEIELLDP